MSSVPLTVPPGGRLLVVKTSSLGDVIHATPCLRAIRRSFPEAQVAMAVDRRFVDAVAHNPHLDAVVETLPSLRGPLRLPWGAVVRLLREARPAAALDLQGTRGSAALVYASRARWQGGRGGPRPGWQLVCRPAPDRHAVRVCADIVTAAGIEVTDLGPELFPSVSDDEALLGVLRERLLPPSGFALVNPFSRWPSKEWPLARYAQLIVALRAQHPIPVVLAGGSDERRGAELLLGMLPAGAATSLVGALSLGQALCLYRRALLMVTGDSGPMHAAAALGTPVVALFGPTLPERTGPWGEGHVVIQERRPASHHAYRRDRAGIHIRAIAVDTVAAAVSAVVASLRHAGSGLRRAALVRGAGARRSLE
jgi:heptosyltransferase-1